MRKVMFAIVLMMGLFLSEKVYAQSLPNFTFEKKSEKQLMYNNQGFPYPSELPPLVLKQDNGERVYVLSTAWSWKCLSLKDILNENVNFEPQKCSLATKPVDIAGLRSDGTWSYSSPNQVPSSAWNREYDGIVGFHKVNGKILAVRHNENYNFIERASGYVYQSPYFSVAAASCSSHYDENGQWVHCWDAFMGGVSVGEVDFDATSGWSSRDLINDNGPAVWSPNKAPRKSDGTRNNAGVYHPTSFVDNGFLYINYIDTSAMGGANGGCRVMSRAPISNNGSVGPFKNWYNGTFNEASLPNGFSKEMILNFVGTAGGRASCLFPESNAHIMWFNVAKIKGTGYYLGVEESYVGSYPDYNEQGRIGLRISQDLVHWSPLKVIMQVPGGWGNIDYSYPVFYDRTTSSNYEIDGRDFYIVGNRATGGGSGYELKSMRLSIDIDGLTMPEVTVSGEERLVWQYFKEFFGWDLGLNSYGFVDNVSIFRTIGCKEYVKQYFVPNEIFTNGFKRTKNDEEYVQMLYRALLSREADPSSQIWVERLASGTVTRDSIVELIADSSEASDVCDKRRYFDYNDSVVPTSTTSPANCLVCTSGLAKNSGNANCDGSINMLDFGTWYAEYQTYRTTNQLRNNWNADFNCDQRVNNLDFAVWYAGYVGS